MAVSQLTNNLQPGMSTTINSLISTDLKKDSLMFARLIVACPKPRAGASSAGGAGDVPGGKCHPRASCAVFLHHKNTFTSGFFCTFTQPQGHTCPYTYCTASPPLRPVPSNPPDEAGNGSGCPNEPSIRGRLPSHNTTGNSEHGQPRKAPAQVLLLGGGEEGKVRKAGEPEGSGGQLLDQPPKI